MQNICLLFFFHEKNRQNSYKKRSVCCFFLTFMKDVLGQNIAKVTTNTSNFQRDLLGKHLTVSCRKKLFIAKKE